MEAKESPGFGISVTSIMNCRPRSRYFSPPSIRPPVQKAAALLLPSSPLPLSSIYFAGRPGECIFGEGERVERKKVPDREFTFLLLAKVFDRREELLLAVGKYVGSLRLASPFLRCYAILAFWRRRVFLPFFSGSRKECLLPIYILSAL